VVGEGAGWWWWLVIIVARGWLLLGEEVGWWWCHGVVVVGERTCGGVRSVDVEKRYKRKPYFSFFMSFSSAVGAILDSGGIHCPLRCCAGHLFSWGVGLGMFFSEFKVGGVGTYLEHICMHFGGFFLEKVPVYCK
jgi:hypothetical protein